MPVGQKYQFGPLSVGPFYPENLPFGIGPAVQAGAFSGPTDRQYDPALDGVKPWRPPELPRGTQFQNDIWAADRAVGDAIRGIPDMFKLDYFNKDIGQDSGPTPPVDVVKPPVNGPGDPAGDRFKSLLDGLGGPTKMDINLPAGFLPGGGDYSKTRAQLDAAAPDPYAPLDYTKARDWMAQAAPDGKGELTDKDKMLYVLSGLARGGMEAMGSGDIGQMLFAMGMGSLGGLGKYRDVELAEKRDIKKDQRAYALGMGGFEGDLIRGEGQRKDTQSAAKSQYHLGRASTEAQIAGQQSDNAWRRFSATQPKLENGYLMTSNVGKNGQVDYSMTSLPDPALKTKMAFLALGTKPTTNVSTHILAGKDIEGLDPTAQAAIRTTVMNKYQEVLASPEYQKMLTSMAMGGAGSKVDPTELAMMLVDQVLQANDPQLYSGVVDQMTRQHIFSGLGGLR